MRITEIARDLKLHNPESRRHLSRLNAVGLIQRDNDGYYHITSYGETVLISLQEIDFMSSHKDYLISHILTKIPIEFLRQIGALSGSKHIDNALNFLLQTENLFRESKKYIWLLVDQFPLNSLSTIIEAISRGVQFKIIEPFDRILSPNIDSMTSEDVQALTRARHTPLVEQRILYEFNVNLYLSENRCVIAFPTSDGQYDYTGFSASDASSLNLCKNLFQYYWDNAEQVQRATSDVRVSSESYRKEQIVIEGRNDPHIDPIAIQDAVDNFNEVILRGRFNLGKANLRAADTGTTCIKIRKSVTIRGEGRENNIPMTKIVKSNWMFPFLEYDFLFEVDGLGIDVTIENLHFQDFNGSCIAASRGNRVVIRNNRITLRTGLGRGQTYGHMGDRVTGIEITVYGGYKPMLTAFPGGVVIEDNYIDFALTYELGGFISRKKMMDPNYRPDHENHETYNGIGVLVNNVLGKVLIRNNVIRNMNAKGIVVQDNYNSTEIRIEGNSIISEVFGSYAFSTHIAGYGIQCLCAWSLPRSGTSVEIINNEIRCEKLNYYGVAIYGLSMYKEGAGKFGLCIVRDNRIHLTDGHVCVLIRKNDSTEVY